MKNTEIYLEEVSNYWGDLLTDEDTGIAPRIYRLNSLMRNIIEKDLKKFDVSFQELNILMHLNLKKDLKTTSTQLYKSLLFTSGGMSKILNKIVKKGLITFELNDNDSRSKYVHITKSGITLVEEAFYNVVQIEKEIFQVLNKTEKKHTLTGLKKVINKIETI